MATRNEKPDVVLIGAGIMSATLGTVLKELEPSLSIAMFETLEGLRAGKLRGVEQCRDRPCRQLRAELHAAAAGRKRRHFEGPGGQHRVRFVTPVVGLSRAARAPFADPRAFIHPCPHMSFVWGRENIAFLRARYHGNVGASLLRGMEYSEDRAKIAEWAPLIMEGRDASQPVAATQIVTGSDVDYGALTRLLVAALSRKPGFDVSYNRKRRRSRPRGRRPLAGDGRGHLRRHARERVGRLCLHRRRRRLARAAAGFRHSRGTRLWRLPGERHLAALRRRCDHPAASCQGLWQGRGRIAAHVGAPSRHPRHRRQDVAAVRPLCRLLQQIPQARLADRPVQIDHA